jgi:ribosomal protein S4E
MDDSQLKLLITTIQDIMDDYVMDGHDIITISSVLLAVAIKQIKLEVDDEQFRVILDDISEYELYNIAEDELAIREYKKQKRTLH